MRDQGLHGDVELAAEAAAAGGRANADLVGRDAEHARHLAPVEIGALGRDGDLDAVTLAHRPAGLGLEIGMLDEAGLEVELGGDGGGSQSGVDIAGIQRALGQHVTRPVGVQIGGIAAARSGEGDGLGGLPGDGQVRVAHPGHCVLGTDQCEDRLAAEADMALGQDRLVLAVGKDGEAVDARHVGGGQDADAEAGLGGGEVAQAEAGAAVRRADDAEMPGIERDRIGAEASRCRRPCACRRA